ncbi:60S acidic ribosomal protein P2 [Hibiscus syriacus]|uniref:60S acidic ribosomal protein P2 n=1 Tax=Hibiscus syriacus TaxID=106335 RepID=A0A6A2WWJ0_HIBSY|nr:60S acidic ribosomal protein P2 [Hibiscus syriacus]
MKVVGAYLLALLGSNTFPSAEDINNILDSVGAEAEEERLQFLLSKVKGKDITELIASGREKFASVPHFVVGVVVLLLHQELLQLQLRPRKRKLRGRGVR